MKQKVELVNRSRRTLTEKGREYRISILGEKKSRLVSRIIRKSGEINDLLYSYQNSTTIKEELAQLNNICRLIVEINDEITEIDVNYSEEHSFAEIDKKVFSFKHKIHYWLREGENGAKREKDSKSSGCRSKSSGSSRSSGSRSSRRSSKEKAIQEKLRAAQLRTEASFMKKKKEAELQAESLRLEEEMAKAEAKVKTYEQDKLEAKVRSKVTSKNPLDSPDIIFMILSKVPGHLQDRWNRNALKIRRTETRESGLLDLTNFIEDKMILVNDPLFSRAVGQYDKKPQDLRNFRSTRKFTHMPSQKMLSMKEKSHKVKQGTA